MTATIGIDPGLGGAVAYLGPAASSPAIWDTPTLVSGGRRRYEAALMVEVLQSCLERGGSERPVAFLEHVHSMPREGVSSAFTFGRGLGLWEGLLAALGIPYELVSPQSWRRAMLSDTPADKGASRLRAMQLFPELADLLKRAGDHNRADAILIAAYGQRKLKGD